MTQLKRTTKTENTSLISNQTLGCPSSSFSGELHEALGLHQFVEEVYRKSAGVMQKISSRMNRLLGFSVPIARRGRLHKALGIEQLEARMLLTAVTISDEFDTISFGGNNGDQNWSNAWQEIGESDGPDSGDVKVKAEPGFATKAGRVDTDELGEGMRRRADLSTASSATLTFSYKREAGGQIDLEVFDGTSWNLVHSFDMTVTDSVPQPFSADISAYTDANTEIRFLVTGQDGDGRLWFDDVQIAYVSNGSPVTVNDSYSITEDTTLNIAAEGVLANDTDVDGDPLSAILVAGPSSGSLTLNADGSFGYTPDANFNGSDSFTYKANDGTANGNTATVTITVNAQNDAPITIDDGYATNEDTTLNIAAAGVLANDSDADTDPLTAILVAGPSNGSLTLNADGSFDYTPDGNFNGSDSFTYKSNDGTIDGNTATVTITVNSVNDTPTAVNDTYSVDEDNTLNIAASGILANDTDVEGNPLSAILVAGPSSGSLSLNADGSFGYTPNANFNGSDSFTYKSHDGMTDGNTATVTIAVNALPLVDIQPIFSTDDSVSIPFLISPNGSSHNQNRPANDLSPVPNADIPSLWEQSGHRGNRIALPSESHVSDSQPNELKIESTTTPTKSGSSTSQLVTTDSNSKSNEQSTSEYDSSPSYENSQTNSSANSFISVFTADNGDLESGHLEQQNSFRNNSQSNNNLVDTVFSHESVLFTRLDNVKSDINQGFRSPEGEAAIVTTVTVFAGYILYVIRKNSFLSAFFSFAPHWKRFDPLVVQKSLRAEKSDPEGNDAETLMGVVNEHSIASKD